MNWKLIITAIAFSLFLLFFGCTQAQPSKTSMPKPIQTNAIVQKTSKTSFFECLGERNTKMYSAGWCDPCYKNIENILNNLSKNQGFKDKEEFIKAFDFFEKHIHVNCTPCQEREHTIAKDLHGILKLGFSESIKYSSECKALGRSLNYENPECTSLHLNQFPTWIFQGKKHSGMISIEALASLTNCRNIFG